MSKTPRISGKEAMRVFERHGFSLVRTTGSHYILKKPGHRYLLTVPIHGNKSLSVGIMDHLIETAGLTVEQFRTILDTKKPLQLPPSPPSSPRPKQ